MKKLTLVLALSFLFAISVNAEGDVPIGGRTCPNQQTTCLVNSEPETETDSTGIVVKTYKTFLVYLKSIFD